MAFFPSKAEAELNQPVLLLPVRLHLQSLLRMLLQLYAAGAPTNSPPTPTPTASAHLPLNSRRCADSVLAGKSARMTRTRSGTSSRRRDCHFADVPSTSLLKPLLKAEGVQ